jgi:hypothetical protein
MTILHVYLDESGTHYGSEALVVAGYLSSLEMWQQFESEWNKALHDYSLPYFHMTDYANGVGDYANWAGNIRTERLGRFIEIINRNTLASYGLAISKKAFESECPEGIINKVAGAYGFAFCKCMIDIANDLSQIGEDVHAVYVLENGVAGQYQILNAYDETERERFKVLSLRFEDKRNFVPLQAADILAYELYKELPQQVGGRIRPIRKSLRLLQHGRTRWSYLDEKRIRDLVSRSSSNGLL